VRVWGRIRTAYRSGVPLVAAGVAVAIGGGTFLPSYLPWLVAAILLWAGLTVRARDREWALRKAREGWHFQKPSPRRREKLRPGEVLDRPVSLTQVPNVPIAEMICSRLRANGIAAYYRGISPFGGDAVGLADLNPALPAEILVGEHQLDQARRLLNAT
jgi:hypothetical protein